MDNMKKSVIAIVSLAIFFSMVFIGCDFRHKERTEYHEGVEDLERYILDDLGDYIHIYSFQKDAWTYSSEERDVDLCYINVIYRESYINDSSKTSDISPIEIVEMVREKYNEFISTNPNDVLSGHMVRVVFSVPIDYYPPEEKYAIISNESSESNIITGDKLTTIRLYEPIYTSLDYTYPFGQWDEFYHITDLEIAELDTYATMDQILEVADNMPFLKYIVVKDQQTADQASALRPDVKFVSVSGG